MSAVELDPNDPRATVCGHCGRGWDDSISTSMTPAPSGRCPFEYDHVYEPKYRVLFQPMVFHADDEQHAIEQYLDALGFVIDDNNRYCTNTNIMDIIVVVEDC